MKANQSNIMELAVGASAVCNIFALSYWRAYVPLCSRMPDYRFMFRRLNSNLESELQWILRLRK